MKTLFIKHPVMAPLVLFLVAPVLLLVGFSFTPYMQFLKDRPVIEDNKVYRSNVVVLERVFVPAGVGYTAPAYLNVGGFLMPLQSSSTSKHVIILKDSDKKIYEIDDLQLWGQVNKGDNAILYYKNEFGTQHFLDIKPIH